MHPGHRRLRPGGHRLAAVERGPRDLVVSGQEVDPGPAVGDQALQRCGTRPQRRRSGQDPLLEVALVVVQQRVLSGPPPLGPGAAPLERLIAYGRARIDFLTGHHEIARAALDGSQPVPAGSQTPMSRVHIRYLLLQMRLGSDVDVLALQLTAALDGPLLLYLSGTEKTPQTCERLAHGWEDLVRRVSRS